VKLGKGYQPDPINHRRTPFAVLAQALGLSSSTLPESTDNCVTIGAVVPVLDQSQTSACVGHAIACAVGWLDFRLPDFGWRTHRPRLAGWIAELDQRPSFAATRPQ